MCAMVGEYYLEKNKTLDCTFACLRLGDNVYRWVISSKVIAFNSLKQDKHNKLEYLLSLEYEGGYKDEEWLEKLNEMLSNFCYAFDNINATMEALQDYYKNPL